MDEDTPLAYRWLGGCWSGCWRLVVFLANIDVGDEDVLLHTNAVPAFYNSKMEYVDCHYFIVRDFCIMTLLGL